MRETVQDKNSQCEIANAFNRSVCNNLVNASAISVFVFSLQFSSS